MKGFKNMQKAYGSRCRPGEKKLYEKAGSITMFLVVLRVMDLMQRACKLIKKEDDSLRGLPILISSHEWTMVHENA